jgi:regulator of RNase E activity RraA
MTHRARFSGATGTVVDGNFRDLEEHRRLNYPVGCNEVIKRVNDHTG